jgi:uncharacterized protein YhaN
VIRLGRLGLIRWGSFTGRTLEFGDPDERLHVVYGGNAAGKSTTRRAVSALLFGVPARTQDAHTHDYGDLRIGAQLTTAEGSIEVVRRKGKANTLLGPDGQPLHDDPIAAAVHALSADAYSGLFEISHESLVDGGRELLAGHGAVGESLFAAAAGTGRLHRLLAALDSDAASLFKAGGRNAELNVALAEYARATRELTAATVRPTRAAELRRSVTATARAIEDLDGTIRERELQCGRLRRLKAVKPMLARHGQLTSELAGLDDPPLLDSDAADRRIAAQQDRDEADRAIRAAHESLDGLRKAHVQYADPDDFLTHGDAVAEAHSQITAIRKAATDRRKREGELQREDARLGDLLSRIRAGMGADELDVHAAHERTRRALDRCLEARGEVAERHRGARTRTTDAERALGTAQAELANVAEAVDTGSLHAAVRAATKLGPIETEAAEQSASASALRAQAKNRHARLEPRPSSLEEFDHQVVPRRVAVHRFQALEQQTADEHSTVERERERLDRQAADLAARRAGLLSGGQAPTARDLGVARELRSEHWEKIRGALLTPVPDADQRADRFERSMNDADGVADARAAQADKLAQTAELDAAEARLASDRERLAERARELESGRSALEGEWTKVWEPSAMSAPPIAEAAQWLSEHEAIRSEADQARAAAEKSELAERAVARHRAVLLARLADVDQAAAPDSTLDELIARAESAAEQLDGDAARRRTAETGVEHAKRQLARDESELADAAAEKAAWCERWERLRADYGLEDDLAPEDAAPMLRAIDDALSARERVGALHHRIDGIDNDRHEFAGEVTRICSVVATDLLSQDPERAASVLIERLGEAQRAREAIDRLADQIEQQGAELAGATHLRQDAQEQLDALLAAAGATEESDLPETERRSARAGELRSELPACEREIAQAGEEAFEALLAAAADVSGEQLDADISGHERQLEALREDRDRAQEATFEAREGLERAERSNAAGQAAEEAQQHLAAARELAERYAVARLSSRLLRDTIERYRTKHQGPMLARANELFPLLTRDTFTELYVDWNDAEEPILLGRDDCGRPLRVEQMSDGTREQLFLALRIAAIERYVESSGAIPVIFDDVFLESDDPRSERIFRALADLAARTQVIVFTHHRHLVALAQQVVDPDRLALHDLDDGLAQLRADGQPALRRAAA